MRNVGPVTKGNNDFKYIAHFAKLYETNALVLYIRHLTPLLLSIMDNL